MANTLAYKYTEWTTTIKFVYNTGPCVYIIYRNIYLFIVSWKIFGSFGIPTLEKLEFMLYPLLSYFDHLVSQVKITILAPSSFIDLGLGHTGSAVLSMSTSKSCLAPKYMFVYSVYYRYLGSEEAKLLSDPR